MATIAQQNDEENQSNNPPTISGTGGGQPSSGVAGSASPVKQSDAPQGGNQYNDVSGYLNANQAGSSQLGNMVSQNLTNQYNQTKSGIDSSANATNQGINKGYTQENTDLINQVATNPLGAVADPNQVAGFQAQLNDSYTGPSSWTDLGTQQGNVASAQQTGNLYKTQGGANVLAQQVEQANNQGYNSGINNLDALLLHGNPDAYSKVASASQPFNTLGDYLNSQNTAIGNNIQSAQNNASKASQDALNAFTGANGTLTNLNNTINQNASSQLSQQQASQAQLQKDIANLYGGVAPDTSSTSITGYGGSQNPWYNTTNYNVGDLAPEDLAQLGLSQDQWSTLKGALQQAGTSQGFGYHNFGANSPTSQIDLNQFLNMQDPSQTINASTVATPEQYQQMAAIKQLLGSQTPQNLAINPDNASLAGTASSAKPQFDYSTALSNAQQIAASERQAAQDEANSIGSAGDAAHAQSQHGGWLSKLGDAAGIVNPVTYLANKAVVDNLKKPS